MAIKTSITEMLGIEHPIVQGGMMHVGYAELASAVSNAGGLGIVTALTQPSPVALREEIERCRGMTSKPFGAALGYPAGLQVLCAGDNRCRRQDRRDRRHAGSARAVGDDDIPGLILIPVAADKVKIPLLASGGFGDRRGLVAALALGADGIDMGTRFCATREAPIHPHVKQKYVENDERGTNLIFRSLHNTARVGKSDVSDEVVRRLRQPGAKFEDVRELVSGKAGAELLQTGDLSKGIFWAGMVQGLIHDIPTCAELIERIVREAEEIIEGRLGGMLG